MEKCMEFDDEIQLPIAVPVDSTPKITVYFATVESPTNYIEQNIQPIVESPTNDIEQNIQPIVAIDDCEYKCTVFKRILIVLIVTTGIITSFVVGINNW